MGLAAALGDRPCRADQRQGRKGGARPFIRAIWSYRAITLIDGWYEWVDEGGPKKQPYYIQRRDGRPALCASIGQSTGGEHDGFVIITADAQGGMVDIHDRRPVVLSLELATERIAVGMPSEHAEQLVLNLGEPIGFGA